MTRINGRRCRDKVVNHEPFKGYGSIYGRKIGARGYGVFSYGEHWPLHVWDGKEWWHNEDKYSVTTSHHYSQSHPLNGGRLAGVRAMLDLVSRLDAEDGRAP